MTRSIALPDVARAVGEVVAMRSSRPPPARETLASLGFGELEDLLVDVLVRSGGAARTEWRTRGLVHHLAKAVSHATRYHLGQRRDPDTGASALVHVALRCLMAAAQEDS